MSRPRSDHTSWPLILAGVTAALFIVFSAVLYETAPTSSGPPLAHLTLESTLNARIIAEAIATPPQPVPDWLAFIYPWQSFASAVFALIAAFVGAWALMKQADASRQAVGDQIAAAAAADHERFNHETDSRARESERRRQEAAGALSAEIRTWLNRFGNVDLLQQFQSQLQTARNGIPPTVPIVPIYVEHFQIYDTLCGELGTFSAPLAAAIVESYGALQGVLDAFKGIRSGQYDFLDDVNDGNPAEALKKSKGNARRAIWGLERIVEDLGIFNRVGRFAVEALNHIHGSEMPDVPAWSSTGERPVSS